MGKTLKAPGMSTTSIKQTFDEQAIAALPDVERDPFHAPGEAAVTIVGSDGSSLELSASEALETGSLIEAEGLDIDCSRCAAELRYEQLLRGAVMANSIEQPPNYEEVQKLYLEAQGDYDGHPPASLLGRRFSELCKVPAHVRAVFTEDLDWGAASEGSEIYYAKLGQNWVYGCYDAEGNWMTDTCSYTHVCSVLYGLNDKRKPVGYTEF